MENTSPYQIVDYGVEPASTALIVIDCQNDVLSLEGQYARAGVDISHMRRVIGPINQLVAACRAAGIPVIWTRHGFRNETDAGILLPLRPFLREEGFRQGTWGYEVLDDFDVHEEDWLLDKNRFSCFYNTNLEVLLRGMGAETLLVTGVLTNQCVHATARDAFTRDIKPIVVEECVGTTLPELHGPALQMVSVGFGAVRNIDAILEEISARPSAARQP